MVSEDSQILRGLPVIHRFADGGDGRQPLYREVTPFFHHLDYPHELAEVVLLGSSQRVSLKERDDLLDEISSLVDAVPEEILLVVIASSIQIDLAASEEIDKIVENCPTGSTLRNGKRGLTLPTQGHFGTSQDGGAEAPFAINESNNPADLSESFLLIVRRGHSRATHGRIFTAHCHNLLIGCDIRASTEPIHPGFPAYSQLHSPPSPAGGAAIPRYYWGIIPP